MERSRQLAEAAAAERRQLEEQAQKQAEAEADARAEAEAAERATQAELALRAEEQARLQAEHERALVAARSEAEREAERRRREIERLQQVAWCDLRTRVPYPTPTSTAYRTPAMFFARALGAGVHACGRRPLLSRACRHWPLSTRLRHRPGRPDRTSDRSNEIYALRRVCGIGHCAQEEEATQQRKRELLAAQQAQPGARATCAVRGV